MRLRSKLANGRSAGVRTSAEAPPGETASACLSRRGNDSMRKGPTPLVLSSQISWPSTLTRVMTWSNCDGEGMSGSSLCCEPIRTEVDSKPCAASNAASSVFLSLQSP